MKRHWQYLKYVARHKWFVFQACLKLGVPLWMAILHDWDKFLPEMWMPYARCFYKPDGSKQYVETPEFNAAWNGHQKRNKHHWQYWVLMEDDGATIPMPMPDVYRREMLADWRGAGKAITGTDNTFSWYIDNYYKIKLHRETRLWVDHQFTGWKNPMTLEEIAQSENTDVTKIKASLLNTL